MLSVQKTSFFFEKGKFQDFYDLLKVDINATEEEIKKKYRSLSMIYHPDSLTGDAEMMGKISKAYDILKDPVMRSIYDVFYNDIKNKSSNDQIVSTETTVVTEAENIPSSNNSSSTKSYVNDFKKKGTSYRFRVSPNVIRNTLRRHHYSEEIINSFLSWCQKHHIKITNGKELNTAFSKYLSLVKKSTKSTYQTSNESFHQDEVHYNLKKDVHYEVKKNTSQNIKKESPSESTFKFPFHRETMAGQTSVKKPVSSIRNLQIFHLLPYITLVYSISNIVVFFYQNRNHNQKRDIKVKHY